MGKIFGPPAIEIVLHVWLKMVIFQFQLFLVETNY